MPQELQKQMHKLTWLRAEKATASLTELCSHAQEHVCEGNYSSLYQVAQALAQLQTVYGTAREVKGKGVGAAALQGMLSR